MNYIYNDKIRLELMKEDYITELYNYTTDELLPRYMLWKPNTSLLNYKKVILCTIEEINKWNSLQFAIFSFSEKRLIWSINLYFTYQMLDAKFNKWTIWLWIAREFQSQWYWKEALRLLMRYSFDNLSLNKLNAFVFEKDIVSNKLFLWSWFRRVWVQEKELFKNNIWNNVHIYEIVNINTK